MKKKFFTRPKFWILTGLVLCVTFGILSFSPIVNPTEKDCSKIAGTLHQFWYLEDLQDIQIKIDESDKI